jgi:peroxiredoxin Q/BCP
LEAFTSKNTAILGISPDSMKSHQSFKTKYELPFTLIANPERRPPGNTRERRHRKNELRAPVHGRGPHSVPNRRNGPIGKVYNKVAVAGHAEAILADA